MGRARPVEAAVSSPAQRAITGVTNITEEHRRVFEALSGLPSFAPHSTAA